MSIDIDQNPFDSLRASDYSDAEVLDHWVDIAAQQGGLLTTLKPRLVMPMLLLGSKGSGKTHLMRYCSGPVQAALHDNDLLKAVTAGGYLGVYIRTEGLNIHKFADKGQDLDSWSSVFSMYFELWLVSNLLRTCRPLFSGIDQDFDRAFSERVSKLFDADVSSEFCSVETFAEYVSRVQRRMDFVVNNAALTRSLAELSITFSLGRLIFGVPEILSALMPDLKNTLFVYLIDEAENFTEWQQRLVNTLIRYRRGNATLKLGARLYGIKTYETLGSGEPIKRDQEYERVELDGFLREHEGQFDTFCRELITKRLQLHNLPAVRAEALNLPGMFEELNSEDYYQAVTLDILKTWDRDARERPYFAKFRKELQTWLASSADEIDEIVGRLRVHKFPLIEKALLMLFYRAWPKSRAGALQIAVQLSEQVRGLLDNRRNDSQPAKILKHFGSDLLAQLFRDCQRKSPYAGLETLIHLSQGAPRNLLAVLKHIYRRSSFAGEKPFAGGVISVESQSQGVMDSAAWFWEDAQPESYGTEVRDSIEGLALLFRTIRYSERPSECDLCTFSLPASPLTDRSRRIVETAENWSYLIRVKVDAKNRNNQLVDPKYQLAPMLAPKWGLSPHRRGSIEIKTDLANALFDQHSGNDIVKLVNRRVADMRIEAFGKKGAGRNAGGPSLL